MIADDDHIFASDASNLISYVDLKINTHTHALVILVI